MYRAVVKTLATDGFAHVHYASRLREKVLRAVDTWKNFCRLPDETKKLISYSGDTNVSGVGYELKLEEGSTKDLKEDFHLRLSEREFLEREARKVGPVAQVFVQEALALGRLIEPLVADFTKTVEREFSMPGFHDDTMERMPKALLRFLHYFGDREVGDELAIPHVDKGGFTLHLYESHSGLEYLDQHGAGWRSMDFSEGETVIIPAMRMQYRSRNQLKATVHRVVADRETAKKGRFSAVCFMDFANTPYYDKKKWGRLQDWPTGFNYLISFDKFRTLFEKQ